MSKYFFSLYQLFDENDKEKISISEDNELKDNEMEYFIRLKEDKEVKIFFIILLFFISISPFLFIYIQIIPGIISGIIIWSFDFLLWFIYKNFSPKKIKLTKLENKIKIEYVNSYNKSYLFSKCLLNNYNNVHFKFYRNEIDLNLLLMYDYKDIDLDFNNIKDYPLKLWESFFPIDDIYNEENIEKKVNQFIFNSSKILVKSSLSKYELIEINPLFITFFLKSPLEENYYTLSLFLLVPLIYCFYIKKFKLFVISIIIGLFIFIINYENKDIYRIDFILSKDKKCIFIGLTRFMNNSYNNTFLFEKDIIDKFDLIKIQDNYQLKIMFKGKKKDEIIYNFNKLDNENKKKIILKIEELNKNILG